jgi:hypothetical protein
MPACRADESAQWATPEAAMDRITLYRVLLSLVIFDFENLRRLMSQIRSDNGQRLGGQGHIVVWEITSFAEEACCAGKYATASDSSSSTLPIFHLPYDINLMD